MFHGRLETTKDGDEKQVSWDKRRRIWELAIYTFLVFTFIWEKPFFFSYGDLLLFMSNHVEDGSVRV